MRDLGAAAELGAHPLERLAVGDEDERLLPGLPPERGLPGQPGHPRVGLVRPLREAREGGVLAAKESLERGAGGEGAADAVGLLAPAQGVGRRGSTHGVDELQPCRPAALALDRDADPGRQPADVHASRRARAGRQGLGPREAGLEGLVLGEIGGAQQLEQAEEAVHVVVERDRGEEQDVPAERGDLCHRAPRRAARVAGRAAQPVGLVHHEEVDAGLRRAGRELRPRDERLQGDHGAPVDVEGVEVGAVVPRHVGEPGLVEQHEDLVVLPPQLAQPLHGQRLGRDHQAPLRASGADESAQDEAGLDRLAEPHLVGQQPAHGKGGGRALGGVELVGEQADPPAEEGAEALGLAQRGEVQSVEAQGQVLDGVDVPGGQAFHEVGPRVARPDGRRARAARGPRRRWPGAG